MMKVRGTLFYLNWHAQTGGNTCDGHNITEATKQDVAQARVLTQYLCMFCPGQLIWSNHATADITL